MQTFEVIHLYGGVVSAQKRESEYIAFISGDKAKWEAGDTIRQAVDQLRRSHPKLVPEGDAPEYKNIDPDELAVQEWFWYLDHVYRVKYLSKEDGVVWGERFCGCMNSQSQLQTNLNSIRFIPYREANAHREEGAKMQDL
jgi:hypothetical protein